MTLVLVTGCGQRDADDPQTVREEAVDATEVAGEYAAARVAELQEQLEAQARKLNARLETLREEAKEGGEAIAERTREQLDRVNDALARLDSATEEQRARVQEEVGKLLNDIQSWWANEE